MCLQVHREPSPPIPTLQKKRGLHQYTPRPPTADSQRSTVPSSVSLLHSLPWVWRHLQVGLSYLNMFEGWMHAEVFCKSCYANVTHPDWVTLTVSFSVCCTCTDLCHVSYHNLWELLRSQLAGANYLQQVFSTSVCTDHICTMMNDDVKGIKVKVTQDSMTECYQQCFVFNIWKA